MKKLLIGSLGLLLLASCSSLENKVVIDYDNDANFSEYQTFFWSDEFLQNKDNINQPIYYNSLVKKRIKEAVESEMTGRGYELDSLRPDLLINSHVLVDEKTELRSFNSGYPYYGYGMRDNIRTISTTEGTLVIDIIDRSKKQLVWQGYYSGEFTEAKTPEEKSESIRAAISLIYQKYNNRAGEE